MKHALLIAAALLPVSIASAADLDYAPPPEQPIEAASGWYLRGDVGYTFKANSHGHYLINDPDLGAVNIIHYERLSLGWKHDLSVGVGYQFNHHLRGDLTIGHWGRSVDGLAYYNGVFNDFTYRDTSSLSVWEGLINAYADIGHFGRFTPYLGAGIGLAHVKYGRMTNVASDGSGGGFTGYHNGLSSTRATWALMAGTAIDINQSWKLDLGYRFSRIEGGKAFGWDAADTAAGFTGAQTWDHGFNSHSIRAGLRVSLF